MNVNNLISNEDKIDFFIASSKIFRFYSNQFCQAYVKNIIYTMYGKKRSITIPWYIITISRGLFIKFIGEL